MARIRTIKPEFFTSGDIVELSPLARLFYIGLWCEADREGRLRWNTKTLKLRYLPADDCDIGELERELTELGLVVLYEVDGKLYAEIPSFKAHQVLNNRESESTIPARACDASGTRQARVKAEGRKEGNGKEEETPQPPLGGEGEYPADFEAAWAAYPRRAGGNPKRAAFRAWQARVRAGVDPAELLAGVCRYAEHIRGEGKEGSRYVLQAATFFGPDCHYAEPWGSAGATAEDFDWGRAI